MTTKEVTSCNTCKANFISIDVLKDHYKSSWHIFNSKRRSNNLAPLTLNDFKKVSPNIKLNCIAPKKSPTNQPTSTNTEKNEPKTVFRSENINKSVEGQEDDELSTDSVKNAKPIKNTMNIDEMKEQVKELAEKYGLSEERAEKVVKLAIQENLLNPDYDEEDDEGEGGEEVGGYHEEPQPIAANRSIFDKKEFATTEECVKYMEITYGFFIPDKEYLTDLDGLLCYLGEKVKIGGICLYCQKQLRPGTPCQNHMINKSHCKLIYDDDIDMDEYGDFYDFSSSYSDDESEGNEAQISDIGELVLSDGRIIGHRDLRVYYKQKFRPVDNRPSILSQKREELIKLEAKYGCFNISIDAIQKLSDAEIVGLMVREQRFQRKTMVIAQRQMQRQNFMSQRKEYKSSVAKLRSSATTTEKIRDWHRKL